MTIREKYYNWAQFIPSNIAVNTAKLGPIGNLKAAGTFGSIAGLLFFTVFLYNTTTFSLILSCAILAYIAIGVCDRAEICLDQKDPNCIILDEFVAMPICFIGINISTQSNVWILMILAFAFFRFFDIIKPLGIKNLQNLEGGLGCVADDIAAAIATCMLLHIYLMCST